MNRGRCLYTFFSVHEQVFHRVIQRLEGHYGLTRFAGFVWGEDQRRYLSQGTVPYDPLHVFTRDVLPDGDDGQQPDVDYLLSCERRYDVPILRMIFSERHLLESRSYEEVLRMTEVLFRFVERAYEHIQPDFVFSEDVSCLTSYVHWAVARGSGIPFWSIGNARIPYRLSVYCNGLQQWNLTQEKFAELSRRELREDERTEAQRYLAEFREKPSHPTGTEKRAHLPILQRADVWQYLKSVRRYLQDPRNPTMISPAKMPLTRLRRLCRAATANLTSVFDRPVEGEDYVLFPLHIQPEASTLVQAPYYLDQIALIEDIMKSLPPGYRLYVKEHVSNQGRRPLAFFRRIRGILGVRLLGPHENTWRLLQNAAAVSVITGTMGWEGLLLGKPVITFGDVFYNDLPMTYRAGEFPKDRWHEVFAKALTEHRSDDELLLKFISAVFQTSPPGFMSNARLFPWVLADDNVGNIADALGQAISR
jgi:hypothetical protein